MIILGVDPGLATVGWGVIQTDGNRHRLLQYGTLNTSAKDMLPIRLRDVYEGVTRLIERFHPDHIAVEELFFNTNAKTAMLVGQARGVLVLSAANAGLPVYEYTPLQVKQAVVGYGRADKNQVQQMVKSILSLRIVPKPDDTADALAVAICHAHTNKRTGT